MFHILTAIQSHRMRSSLGNFDAGAPWRHRGKAEAGLEERGGSQLEAVDTLPVPQLQIRAAALAGELKPGIMSPSCQALLANKDNPSLSDAAGLILLRLPS